VVFGRIERAGVDPVVSVRSVCLKENEMLVIRQELRPEIGTLEFRGIQLQDELGLSALLGDPR